MIKTKRRAWQWAFELPRVGSRVILAYGAQIGHEHTIEAPNAMLLESLTGQVFLEVKERAAELRHADHAELSVPPGTWRVVLQKEPDAVSAEG